MALVTTSTGKSFASAEGETLLDAATRAGITWPYSCRTGRCGTCKAQVRSGRTAAIHSEFDLSDAERSAGWVLTCARSAVSDLELAIEDLGDIHLPAARTLPCRIQTLERLSPDVMKVMLRLPPASEFNYLPGQYVDVIAHGGLRRSYSIANAGSPEKQLELHIRQVPDGAMSQYWFEQAKPNDLLRLNGPLGTFFLRTPGDLDLVFLATGTGMAPIKAMLESLASCTQQPRSVSIYWGGRVPADVYWHSGYVGVDHSFVPVLSRAGEHWTGARGYVQDLLLTRTNDWARTAIYACGSEAMIHSARERLVTAGLSEHSFYADAFVCSASV
jgi:CDP-4-dehydro-6-deoxyglucose reductase